MGSPIAIENAVLYGRASLNGLLGNTTPASSKAKLYTFKKGKGTDKVFGPLVGCALKIKAGVTADQLFVFKEAHFVNIFAPKASEIVVALNAGTTGVDFAVETGGHISAEHDTASTSSLLEIKKNTDPKYGDALEVLGFLPSICDIANFKLVATLEKDERLPIMPLVQTHDWNPATNAYSAIAAAPVLSYVEDTGVLTIVSAEAANATVAAGLQG